MELIHLMKVIAVTLVCTRSQGAVQYSSVTTSSGVVRGKVDFEPAVPVRRFSGIPYAKPPVGILRFKPPVEADSWNRTLDAFTKGNICMQQVAPMFAEIYTNTTMSEDCLTLNIDVPLVNSTASLLPVVVSVHGGGYVMGYGALNDGTGLAQHSVVLVTFNYRLDVFGFLSTEDTVMPGNYGMLDQVAALKWVQKNIAAFGGDPNQVTIARESAGASSVSLLILSPLAAGLFHRAIMQSGSSLSAWAAAAPGYKYSHRTVARLIATTLGCPNVDDTFDMMACLQIVGRDTLLNTSVSLSAALRTSIIMPRVENVFNFLPDQPINLLTRGKYNKVDTLRGFNSDEFGMYISFYLNDNLSVQKQVEMISTAFLTMLTDLDQTEILKVMSELTMTNVSDTLPTPIIRRATELQEDIGFVAPTMVEINIVSQLSPQRKHFLYEFNHKPSFSRAPEWMKAAHGDDLPFVFGIDSTVNKKIYTNITVDDASVSHQMLEMWANFAKSGEPTATIPPGAVAWSRYSPGTPNHLVIDTVSQQRMWSRPEVFTLYRPVLKILTGFVTPKYLIMD